MKGIRHYLCSGILILSGIFLTSCATISPNNAGKLGDVSIADASEVGRLSTGLTMADYLGFAENVTNKMLKSRFVQGWGDTKPKLMVGDLVNNTDNEYIRMQYAESLRSSAGNHIQHRPGTHNRQIRYLV
jgi:hypothetical protein